MTVIAVFAFSRFLHALCLMTLFGANVLLASIRSRALASAITDRLAGAMLSLAVLAFVGVVVWLPLEAAAIGEGWPGAVDGTMLTQIVAATAMGKAWCVRVAISLLVCFTAYRTGTVSGRRRAAQVAFVSGWALAALALSGHAAGTEGGAGVLHRIVDAAHALAAGAWLGALLPFFHLLHALRDPESRRDATAALITFSNSGHAAVAITLSSGVLNTWLILRGWPFHWQIPYQVLLCAKIALTVAMVGIAVVNRYVWVPRLAADAARAHRMIRRRTVFGIALGIAVVGLVSLFGTLPPR